MKLNFCPTQSIFIEEILDLIYLELFWLFCRKEIYTGSYFLTYSRTIYQLEVYDVRNDISFAIKLKY